jgi:hypothetical protein
MSNKRSYGRRPRHPGRLVGTRELSTTYGKTAHPLSASKFDNRKVFNVEQESEQLVGQILEIDPTVTSGKPQGLTVDLVEGVLLRTAAEYTKAKAKYRGHPGPCFYTADFVAQLVCEALLAIEVKLDSHPGDPEYAEKLRQATGILGRFGIGFTTVVIPSDQRRPVWSTVPLVCHACTRRELWPGPSAVETAAALAGRGAKLASEYLAEMQLPTAHLAILVASGVLKTDLLTSHLSGRSEVAPALGDLQHLSLLTALRK